MSDQVQIRSRQPSGIKGYTLVSAWVKNGHTGTYTVASSIVGTDDEITEILAQSARRTADIDVTRAGRD